MDPQIYPGTALIIFSESECEGSVDPQRYSGTALDVRMYINNVMRRELDNNRMLC